MWGWELAKVRFWVGKIARRCECSREWKGKGTATLHVGEGLFAEGFEAGLFEGVAVEHVVGVEGDEALGVGVGDVDAGFFDGAEVEGLGVDELDDEDAEEVVVAEGFGGEDLGEAAEEFAEGAGL